MILVRMQISGFLSYLQKVDIDFTQFDLACISGANGAGKSTLLEAITWVLFGEARRKDDAVINQRANTAEVTLDFDYENASYQVQRSKTRDKTTLLELRMKDTDGRWIPLTEATLRATEETIRKTLHLDYETFINASFFLQGRADQFAQQRPGDRKRILSGILGLDIWEEYREEAVRRRRGLEMELTTVEALLAEIEQELAQEGERKTRLKALEKDLAAKTALFEARKNLLEQTRLIAGHVAETRKAVEKQAAEVNRLRGELEARLNDLELRKQEQTDYQVQLQHEAQIRKDVALWEAARQELARWEKIAVNFHQYENQRNGPLLKIEREHASLQQEQTALAQRDTEISKLESEMPGLEERLAALQAEVTRLNARLATRPEIEGELRRLQDAKVQARAENTQLKVEMEEISLRQKNLQQIEGVTCPTCEKPLNAAEKARLIEDLFLRGTARGDAFRANLKLIESCDAQIRQKESELQDLTRADALLKNEQRSHDLLLEEQRKSLLELAAWKANGKKRLEEINLKLTTDDFAQDARAELAVVDARLKELGYDAAAHAQARQAEQEGSTSRERLVQLEQARAALVPLEREIKDLQKTINRDEAHLATLTQDFKAAEAKLQQEAAELPDILLLENEYYESQKEMKLAINEVGYVRNQVDVLDRQREQKAAKTEQKNQLLAQVADLKILERAFGKDGIPALLIEQALPDIQEHANDILDRLSGGDMSISFETQREFKDKKRDDRRETLDILIRDPAGERPYEMFSGGEAFRVNFAIRLALSRVLAQRAGARLRTLVIDEGFGSQDADGRQRLIEAINLVRSDFAKVLVITHLEELKDAFTARIQVTKTDAGSQVQVVAA